MRQRIIIGGLLAVIGVLAAMLILDTDLTRPPPVERRLPAIEPVESPRMFPSWRPRPSPNAAAPEEEAPVTVRAAFKAVADQLGLISLRCHVGAEYEGEGLGGFYLPAIVEGGWLQAVVRDFEGERVVTRRRYPDAMPEEAFAVRWRAEDDAVEAICEVIPIEYASLRVATDPPIEPMLVIGCGASANVVDGEADLLITVTGKQFPCELQAFGAGWAGSAGVRYVGPDAVRDVLIEVGEDEVVEGVDGRKVIDVEIQLQEKDVELEVIDRLLDEAPEGTPAREVLEEERVRLARDREVERQKLEMEQLEEELAAGMISEDEANRSKLEVLGLIPRAPGHEPSWSRPTTGPTKASDLLSER